MSHLKPLFAAFQPIISDGEELPRPRGRPRKADHATTGAERKKATRERDRAEREKYIAVLDTETDPFDNTRPDDKIYPFLAILYSEHFEPITIWDDDFPSFCERLYSAILNLPGRYTIYAHNGGKFDFMFMIHKLRGDVKFKGRGIMAAKIGNHELRDSFHIIPERLASYNKDAFDYQNLRRNRRGKFRQTIIDYCMNDCKYLYELVTAFIGDFGLKISIGQAATFELKKNYDIEQFSSGWDAAIREYYFGGRVECILGRGEFFGPYKNYDVNSMYPDAMASALHPIGGFADYTIRMGEPGDNTCFIDLDCDNYGALIARGENGETTALIERGNFKTTIHEYRMALKLGLIENVKIHYCIDCSRLTNFADFVLPLYEKRQVVKSALRTLEKGTREFFNAKKDDIFYKLLLNNAYGVQAINPRNFKEHYLTDPDELPPDEWFKSLAKLPDDERKAYMLPAIERATHWVWQKPNPSFSFKNVGVAASITGAARAKLMEAISLAVDPIYCDTDSLICRDLPGVEIDKTKLGAWDIEDEFSKVVIAGKKLYAGWYATPQKGENGQITEYKLRSKGTERNALSYQSLVAALDDELGQLILSKGVTITKGGEQFYMARRIRATAPKISAPRFIPNVRKRA